MKGIGLFERLVQSEAPMGVSALADELDLQKSNVHRTLATLVKLGYVEQDAAGRYRPTRRIWEQGMKVIRRDPIRRAAMALMHSLHAETQETISLAVLDGGDCLYLHQITTGTTIRPLSTVGPAGPGGLSRDRQSAARLPARRREARTRALCAKRATFGKRKVSAQSLLEEFATIRKTGYAFSTRRGGKACTAWRASCSAPAQQPVAAIGISGPAERLPKERLKTLTNSVLNACTQIGDALGSELAKVENRLRFARATLEQVHVPQ